MKLFKGILTMPLLLGLLYACNNEDANVDKDKEVTGNNSVVDETTNNNATNNTENEEDERTGIKVADVNYTFTDFDLDVEYADHKSYDVEYENDGNNIYAELDDDLNGVKYNGDKAYENFANALKQLTFDKNTSDEDVRKEVLKAFALDENYQSFELEVKFQSGEEKHYHHNK
ncbi:YusW family protein [Solibacillus silvestris]